MQGPPNRADEDNKPDNGSWSEDQRERSYYYDDACGYETYVPEDDDESDNKKAGPHETARRSDD